MDTHDTLPADKARRATDRKEAPVARRSYQTGCLFTRGRRRKVWVARWREDVIRTDGRRGRRQRSAVLGLVSEIPIRRQAQTLLDERLRPLNQGDHRPQSSTLFADFAQREWMSLNFPAYKLTTRRGYRLVLHRHVLPYFGTWRLGDISKRDVQQFVGSKFQQRRLSWQTVRNMWIVTSAILEAAVQYSYLTENPARGVKFPPRPPGRVPEVLQADAFAALLGQLPEPVATMVTLGALTGMRIGELLALRWRALDLTTGTLHVRESVFEGQFQTPKSAKGTRTLPLGPHACTLLTRHRQRSTQLLPDALVFANTKGRPLRESKLLQRVIQPAARAAGVGRVTWHQLRHVHSSLLHDQGVPAKIVQQQLGHASVVTTLNIYTHVVPDSHRQAIADLEQKLFPSCSHVGSPPEAGMTVTP